MHLPRFTLGIETSCDETAVALVENGKNVLGSLISSQILTHQPFGGVIPEIAAREHLKALDPMVKELLAKNNLKASELNLIGVTQGPGLIGALLVGVSYAKALALSTKVPLMPVNHVHAHVHGALLGIDQPIHEVFPALAAVISGGHTHLYFMSAPTSFELLAASIDDACGESFDKVAKIFGLGYPGGPAVEKAASSGRAHLISMPKMISEKTRMQFSYSGLKTHVLNVASKSTLNSQEISDICAAFQKEALGQLVRKITHAFDLRPAAKSILIAGGVASNNELRRLIAEQIPKPALLPHPQYCTDNGAMIAALAAHSYLECPESANSTWDAYSRYTQRPQGSKKHG